MDEKSCFDDCVTRISQNCQHDPELAERLLYKKGIQRLSDRFTVPINFFGQINVVCGENPRKASPWVRVFLRLLSHFKIPFQTYESIDSSEFKMRESEINAFKEQSHFQELSDYTLVLAFEAHFLLHAEKAFKKPRIGSVVVDGDLPQQGVDDLRDGIDFNPLDVRQSDDRSSNRLLIVYWNCIQFIRDSFSANKPLFDRCSSSIFLLHGKGTFGKWQSELQEHFRAKGFHVESGNYDFVSQLSFFNPRRAFLRKKTEEVQRSFCAFCERAGTNSKFAVVHSLGSFLFVKAIYGLDNCLHGLDNCLQGLILCGSIVRKDDGPLLTKFVDRPECIINEIGNQDIWPAVASGYFLPYGQVGFDGFRNSGIRDRFHEKYRHSDFFNRDSVEKYWLPFFESGAYVPGTARVANDSALRVFMSRIPLDLWIFLGSLAIFSVGWLVGLYAGCITGVLFVFLVLTVLLWLM